MERGECDARFCFWNKNHSVRFGINLVFSNWYCSNVLNIFQKYGQKLLLLVK